MKNVLWILLLLLVAMLILMVTLTFMQPEFREEVGANFLFLHTRPIPVYIYIFVAFIAGVLLGSLPLLAAYLGVKRETSRQARVIRNLKANLDAQEKPTEAGEGVRGSVADTTGVT